MDRTQSGSAGRQQGAARWQSPAEALADRVQSLEIRHRRGQRLLIFVAALATVVAAAAVVVAIVAVRGGEPGPTPEQVAAESPAAIAQREQAREMLRDLRSAASRATVSSELPSVPPSPRAPYISGPPETALDPGSAHAVDPTDDLATGESPILRIGQALVAIDHVHVHHGGSTDFFGVTGDAGLPYISITLRIRNSGPGPLKYTTARGEVDPRLAAALIDDTGTWWPRLNFRKIPPQATSASMFGPGHVQRDVLVFERAHWPVRRLHLSLAGGCFESEGVHTITIPLESIEQEGDPSPASPPAVARSSAPDPGPPAPEPASVKPFDPKAEAAEAKIAWEALRGGDLPRLWARAVHDDVDAADALAASATEHARADRWLEAGAAWHRATAKLRDAERRHEQAVNDAESSATAWAEARTHAAEIRDRQGRRLKSDALRMAKAAERAAAEGRYADAQARYEEAAEILARATQLSTPTATFFDVQAKGRRFAYLIDRSGSMGQERKMSAVLREVVRSITALQDDARFIVVLFSTDLSVPDTQSGWLEPRRATIQSVQRWLEQATPGGGTDPRPALTGMFELDERPDVIFMLTDGQVPNLDPEFIRTRNRRGTPVTIHTFTLGDARSPALERIATDSGGGHQVIRNW